MSNTEGIVTRCAFCTKEPEFMVVFGNKKMHFLCEDHKKEIELREVNEWAKAKVK